MDAVVQFVRNALCTAKNFNVFPDSFLYDPKVTAQYYQFPSPLNETTPLEIIIAVTQLYAFVTVSLAGYKLITRSGVWKLQLISRLVNARAMTGNDKSGSRKKDKDEDKMKSVSEAVARRLVSESLIKEADVATRSFFVGVNVFAIGVAFFWLVANSFHVTSTNWIGGISGLIHALTVMEMSLLVLLYYMLKDGAVAIRKSFRMRDFASKISGFKTTDLEKITIDQYSWLVDGWSPFWAEGTSGSAIDVAAEGKLLIKEEEAIASKLASFLKKIDKGISDRIQRQSRIALFEGYREYVYLVLNFFAFYGYLACILVFYFPDEKTQPEYLRAVLLWLPNQDADWLGNAVGDFMWTLEPIIILTSPMIINSMSPKQSLKDKTE